MYSRICTTRARVHGEVTNGSNDVLFIRSQLTGSKWRNYVVFWGGNGMRRVHGRHRNTSCSSGGNWLGRNSRNEVWHTAEWRKRTFCSTAYGRNGVLFIGKGLSYRKMEETDLCSTAY